MTERVEFRSGATTLVGHLYNGGPDEPRPCVVLCQGFGGTQDTPALTANATGFAAAGYVALTFDYRNFGESQGEPRQLVDIGGQLDDIAAAVTFARGRSGIDPDRIVLWGSSLGGGHVVTAAARDPRIAAAIAQIPFNGFPKKVEGRSTAATLRLLWAMATDTVRGALGASPTYIKAVGQPGEPAVMATSEAHQTIEGMQSATWRNEVAPRALFAMMRYKPGDHAPRVRAPVLVCIGKRDKETQEVDAARLAELAPRGELTSYDLAHFDFYRDDVRQRVIADQIAFLRRVLA
ncbi:alpha/beta hydrolase fold protein [Mycolicibacterium flavescens]|uniref:alpha/beta hydrolase n=1 Tax=Mycobacterium neumannii TaxID=2048551 RepID=UPI000B93B69D|nr:alpha/beta fold hydrolase [Mycobacterium neumannii]VEG41909.1 alpha/beta hydrolase fold protein [Mycolicibacterium flavescens]